MTRLFFVHYVHDKTIEFKLAIFYMNILKSVLSIFASNFEWSFENEINCLILSHFSFNTTSLKSIMQILVKENS